MESGDVSVLIDRVRRGDQEALADFIVARHGALMAYVERHLGAALRTKLEPDDVIQEVSAEAIRSLGCVDLAQRDPFGWLCQLAERRIVDAHRRFFGAQKRNAAREVSLATPLPDASRHALVDMLVASMTTASRAFSRDQNRIRLEAAMADLPELQREALRLRYIDGLSSKEIAQRLGKTDGAVRVMLTRALDRFQKLLAPQMGE